MSRIYKISLLLAFFPAVAFTGEFLSLDLRNFSVSHQKFDSTPKIDSNYLILKKLPDGLYAAPYELTQRQWELVMGDRPSFFCNDKYYADRPVECVSYDNALKFLEVISVKSGIKFVLPTMEEWEYAARAGTEGDFTDGSKMLSPDHDKALDRLARYYYTGGKGAMRDSDTSSGTAKVGSYAPNAWGLYDMLGNVREWALGDAKCGTRMFTRGGAWALNAKKSSISKFEYFPDRTSDSPTSGLRVFSRLEKFEGAAQLPPYEKVSPYKGPMIAPDDREGALRLWKKYMDPPAEYLNFEKKIILVKKFDWPECDGELYLQANGPGTFQKVLLTFPKNMKGKVPGIVVPYYRPDWMIARNFETGADIKGQLPVAFMRHFAERGWASMSSETFHLNFMPENKVTDFSKWTIVANKMKKEYPSWNCMGKKVFDTRIATDFFLADSRIDTNRVGICGHSLGGQGSFCSGMTDDRIKVVVASDFGMRLDQTFWESPWYWSNALNDARRHGFDNNHLLHIGRGKPFCIISGKTDDSTSQVEVLRTGLYDEYPDDFLFLNHQKAHRPPMYILETAYRFMERKLNEFK